MNATFTYDVFLSHNAKDKVRVRQLAERMRSAGLSVWFADWIVQPGDDIYLAIEKGLETSRTLVLCMSPAAFKSDWVDLERSTGVFRDPANRNRRFIPVLLADCKIPDALRRHAYVDLRTPDETQLERLFKACLSPGTNEYVSYQLPADDPVTTKTVDAFLDAIGLHHSIGQEGDRFSHLDELFVPPAEFPDIQRVLDKNNFVLLLGDPEIGKTYTAIYLLYQYFQDGYQPFWESVRDLETSYGAAFQRLKRPRFDLDDYVRRRLDGRNAIYIEDPWGKINFEMPQEFTSSLESLINRVRASQAKLIITSRSAIFTRLTDLVGKDFVVTLRTELVYGGTRAAYGEAEKTRLRDNYFQLFHGNEATTPGVAKAALSRLHSPNSIREFCYLTRNCQSEEEYDHATAFSAQLDRQFAIEIIRDASPEGRRHRAALILFLYVIEHSRKLLYARNLALDFSREGPRSFEQLYNTIIDDFGPLPLDPLKDALETLGDRVVYRQQDRRRFDDSSYWQFTHPIYLDGVKRALADPEVHRLMTSVVLALGEEYECSNCGYNGPYIHAYKYLCNELAPEGPVCPKCHTWLKCVYVLEGISLPYSLEPVYKTFGMIRIFTIAVADEKVKVTILGEFLQRFTVKRLVEIAVGYIHDICEAKEPLFRADEVYLQDGGDLLREEDSLSSLSVTTLALQTKTGAAMGTEQLAQAIHAASTDIDW
jgi:hypothetical protein